MSPRAGPAAPTLTRTPDAAGAGVLACPGLAHRRTNPPGRRMGPRDSNLVHPDDDRRAVVACSPVKPLNTPPQTSTSP